jgi:hypothetical protein
MSETKQGLEVIIRWKAGAAAGFTSYIPDAAGAADITFIYKRSVDWNWNYNVRPVHNHIGQVTHYKAGIGSGTLTLNGLYVDEADFTDIRTAVTGSSVPWGYMEVQFLDTTGAVEFALQMRRIVLSERSNSNPDEDSTYNMTFQLFENPVKLAAGAIKLTS